MHHLRKLQGGAFLSSALKGLRALRRVSHFYSSIRPPFKEREIEKMKKETNKIKVRGTGTFDPTDNSFGFTAFNEAPSTQQDVRKCAGGGKSWLTTGSNPSRMFTLKTKASSPDQYADVLAQFNALTKELRPKQPMKMPDSQRVVAEDGLQCWVNTKKGEMTFTGTIDLSKHPKDWQAEVLRQVQLVVRRLPANEKFNKVLNNIQKGGNK